MVFEWAIGTDPVITFFESVELSPKFNHVPLKFGLNNNLLSYYPHERYLETFS